MVYFVGHLLRCAVLSLTIGFFIDFRVSVSDDKVSIGQNRHIKSYSSVLCSFGSLDILCIFFITNCISLELFLFFFKLDVALSSKGYNIFDYMFLRMYN